MCISMQKKMLRWRKERRSNEIDRSTSILCCKLDTIDGWNELKMKSVSIIYKTASRIYIICVGSVVELAVACAFRERCRNASNFVYHDSSIDRAQRQWVEHQYGDVYCGLHYFLSVFVYFFTPFCTETLFKSLCERWTHSSERRNMCMSYCGSNLCGRIFLW